MRYPTGAILRAMSGPAADAPLRAIDGSSVPRAPAAVAREASGVAYLLRRSPRARRLRLVLDGDGTPLVTLPVRAPIRAADEFVVSRRDWIERHRERYAAERARHESRGPLGDGGTLDYSGQPHRLDVRVEPRGRRSRVEHDDSVAPTIRVRLAPADGRPLGRVLEAWLRREARGALDATGGRTGAAARRRPGRGPDPGTSAAGGAARRGPAGSRSRGAWCSRRRRCSTTWWSTSWRTWPSSAIRPGSGSSSARWCRRRTARDDGCASTPGSCTGHSSRAALGRVPDSSRSGPVRAGPARARVATAPGGTGGTRT